MADPEAKIAALQGRIRELEAENAQLSGLVDTLLRESPYGILVADRDGQIFLSNKAATTIWTGTSQEESIGDGSRCRGFHEDGRPFAPEDWGLATSLRTLKVLQPREINILRFDDTPGVLLGSAAPLFGHAGELVGAVSLFADITPLKERDRALQRASARYLATLRCLSEAVLSTGPNGRIAFMNPVAEQLTGWSQEDAVGRPLREVCRAPDSQQEDLIDDPTLSSPVREAVLASRCGRELQVELMTTPLLNAEGESDGGVIVIRDATARRREEARLRVLAEASAALVASGDVEHTLRAVARFAVPTMADWCAVDLVRPGEGSIIERLAVHHEDPAKVELAVAFHRRYPPNPDAPFGVHHVVRTGESVLMALEPDALELAAQNAEHLAMMKALEIASFIIVPLQTRESIVGTLTFVTSDPERPFDSSDLHVAQEIGRAAGLAVDNARLLEQANNANRAKDHFLATISHELRTPLNAMLGWAQLLRREGLSAEQRATALEVMERNARAQAQLVGDLLDISRIVSGKLRLDEKDLDFGAIVREALTAFRPAAQAQLVELIGGELLGIHAVRGDPDRLHQVISNLLSNALKFTPSGGSITLTMGLEDDMVVLRITDTGGGIAPDLLPHIFERFKQASDGTARTHGGLGLGLAIVASLMELHKGSVAAHSDGLGHGATFEVRLPALNRPSGPGRTSRTMEFVGGLLAGLDILVVDDTDDAREMVAVILLSRGAAVHTASSGRQGLEELAKHRPDLIISDIGMPDMDGYAFLREVRSQTATNPYIPAIALTAFAGPDDRELALEAGFQTHLAKPVDIDLLLSTIADLLGLE